MERLIADANKWAEENGKAADLSIDSFSDVVTAIDYIQQKQGVAGTTAREAMQTISGSIGMLKGAWTNLLSGLGDGEANINELVNNVITSFEAVVSNIEPVVERVTNSVVGVMDTLLPKLAEKLPPLITSLFTTAVELIGTLADGLADAVPKLLSGAGDLLKTVGETVIKEMPKIFKKIAGTLKDIGSYLSENLPTIISDVLDMVQDIADMLAENAPIIVDGAIQLFMGLAQGLAEALPTIIEKLPTIISTIANIINDNAPTILKAGVQIIITLVKGIIESIPTLVANIPKIFQAIIDVWQAINWLNLGKTIITGIKDGAVAMFNTLKEVGGSIIETIKEALVNLPSTLMNLGKTGFHGIIKGIKVTFSSLKQIVGDLILLIVDGLASLPSKLIKVGKDVIKGLWKGISDMTGWLLDKISGFVSGTMKGIKKFFGIHSPSRRMRDEVGKFIPLGMAQGIDDTASEVESAMEDLYKIPNKFSSFDIELNGGKMGSRGGSNSIDLTDGGIASGNTYNLYVNQPVKSPIEMMEEIRTQSQYGLILEGAST